MWNKGGLDQDLDKWGEGVKSGIRSGDRDNQTQQKIESAGHRKQGLKADC